MLSRRDLLAAGTAAGLAQFAPTALRATPQPRRRVPIIDALGEVRLEYDHALLDEMRGSGLSGCVVTAGNPALQGATAHADLVRELDEYARIIAASGGRLEAVTDAAGIERTTAAGRIGLLYYTQNASPIGDDVAGLDDLHRRGVRIVQLTYNTRNLLGDGCLERTNAGLSRFGIEVVEAMNARRMLVDLSHCGEATTMEGIERSLAPVAITHSGCREVFDHPRNKSDAVLRRLAERGGVIGIFQINPYLGPAERNTLEDVMRHIDHAVKLCGVEQVGIGSDREHRVIVDTPEEVERLRTELSRLRPSAAASFRWPFFVSALNHPRRMETLADALSRRGRPAREIELLLGGNFLRRFRETL